MMTDRIRPKAVCVCRRGDQILVGAGVDTIKGATFFGPPGGGVEFGERAADAVCRELREEFGVELTDVTPLGVLENVFTYEGQPGHEIVFVFEAHVRDAALYERDTVEGTEGTERFVAHWLPLAHFGPGGPPLYPEGLLELLVARGA